MTYRGSPMHVSGWAKRFLFRDGAVEHADPGAVRRRAGANLDRPSDASARRCADFGRADQRSGHSDAGSARRRLLSFPGALVLVTHDRYLLDRVSTESSGARRARRRGPSSRDCSQWEAAQKPVLVAAPAAAVRPKAAAPAPNRLSSRRSGANLLRSRPRSKPPMKPLRRCSANWKTRRSRPMPPACTLFGTPCPSPRPGFCALRPLGRAGSEEVGPPHLSVLLLS